MLPPFETELAQHVWDQRYRDRYAGQARDRRIEDSWRRLSHALAAVETKDRAAWEERFYALLAGFRFLPGGRILAGAGSGRSLTLFNCFVMGPIGDSLDAIFDALKEGALTMQAGGGVGYDFSTLRPQGTLARRRGGLVSGPVSFMRIWDAMCATLVSSAARRGAMMATLRCDHPDIEAFIDAKRDPQALRNFNLSVLVTDDFMAAVEADRSWPLVFPIDSLQGDQGPAGRAIVHRRLPGQSAPVPCAILQEVPARRLWGRLMTAAYDMAEPGVLFVDRMNRDNNLWYRESISATNPCGEVPLPPYGACNLGSLNLTQFVQQPFSPMARLDFVALEAAAALAVRLLDNVIDISPLPLPSQSAQVHGARRLGLGITGLADSLILLGLHYASAEARALASEMMRRICHAAYRASIDLVRERGPFPFLDTGPYLAGPFARALPEDIRAGIQAQGIRNSHLIAIAPAGTISLLANGVSSGLEPLFDYNYRRRVRDGQGGETWFSLTAYALRHWRRIKGDEPPPTTFVRAQELAPTDHLAMQAALQPFVDNAIAKTVNVPETISREAFQDLYLQAYRLGLKGCTLFRPNPISGSVLREVGEDDGSAAATGCCER